MPTTHGVPTIVSFFFPGVGQLIKGHIIKGLVIILGMLISFALMIFLIGFITAPVLWLWNLYDAYNSNKDFFSR